MSAAPVPLDIATDRRKALCMRYPSLLTAVAFLAASPSPAAVRSASNAAADSALHGYVLGRFAASDDELGKAARYFDVVRAQDPGSPALTRRAFDLAVASGDRDRATGLAREIAAAGKVDTDVALVQLVDAVLRKDWPGADAARASLASAGYAIVVGPLVEAWARFGRGDHKAALDLLQNSRFSGFSRSYAAEQRAHMLAADGQWQAAADAYAQLGAGTGAGIGFLRIGEADARAMAGDMAGALAALKGDDNTIVAARQRLAAGKRIGALAPDPRRGIGWMMARLATDLSRDKPVPLALLFARAGTFLAPDIPATWLICGDVLARAGQRESALIAYAHVGPGDPLEQTATERRASVLEALGRDSDAGALLAAAVAQPSAGVDDWTRLGDWHRRASRFGEAAQAYTRAIAIAAKSPGGAGWGLYFLRGSMKERSGDWPGAEADLRSALQTAPDEPVVLNYLGYSLLDRGEVSGAAGSAGGEAIAMIERAAALRPGDGGVVDSLGWSQYRQGRFDEAVVTLERAQALEPTDAAVTDHLGDAYWRVGRRIEARFRWRTARDLDPDEKLKQAIIRKLDYGLDAALALAEVAPPR
jgi:Flp pilus assembly protein TadD